MQIINCIKHLYNVKQEFSYHCNRNNSSGQYYATTVTSIRNKEKCPSLNHKIRPCTSNLHQWSPITFSLLILNYWEMKSVKMRLPTMHGKNDLVDSTKT